jgi:peroxiredoxin
VSRNTPALAVTVGDPIPSIGLRATDGYLLNLRSWVGKTPVGLLFFTGPTATGDAKKIGESLARDLAAAVPRLTEAGVGVVGITADNERQQSEFASSLNLPFLLMSDERLIGCQSLGVPVTTKRGTTNVVTPVLIGVDETGIIRGIFWDPDPRLLVAVVLEVFREPLPA